MPFYFFYDRLHVSGGITLYLCLVLVTSFFGFAYKPDVYKLFKGGSISRDTKQTGNVFFSPPAKNK